MSYTKATLLPGEVIIYEGRLSLWSLQGWIMGGLFFCALFGLPGLWGVGSVSLGVLLLTVAWLRFASTEMAVTSRRVLSKRGLIARHTAEIELSRVEGIEVAQSVAQRLMGYGTVLVSGVGSHRAAIQNVAHPIRFAAAFRDALRQHAGGGVKASSHTD